MEYGSEFDLNANQPFRGAWEPPADAQLFRSGRDALKAFARLAGKKRVLLPALCCESMLLPFRQNGYELAFYRLRADFSAEEADVRAKCGGDTVLLYMRYFGIRPFTDAFLAQLRAGGEGLLFLEDRTHDILVERVDDGFQPDAVAASLRKWAALPEGGMLQTRLGAYPAPADGRYGALRLDAMEKKSRWLTDGGAALRAEYSEELHRADSLLDADGAPVAMHPRYEALLRGLDFAAILAARRRNLRRLRQRLAPLIGDGTIRLMTDRPEDSGLYLPILVQNRDAVAQALFRRRLYCPKAIWPEPPEAAGVCPVSHAATEHMLALLCDQRYTEADMDYLAETLTEIIREENRHAN